VIVAVDPLSCAGLLKVISQITMNSFVPRHIQDLNNLSAVKKHWGYDDQPVPCTSDPGSCEYLAIVYHSHDLGVLYNAILWATIMGILLIWGSIRLTRSLTGNKNARRQIGSLDRLKRSITAWRRHYLLPEALRPIFGRTTRLQITILAVLTGYVAIWSFIGIKYKTWKVPVKKHPELHSTRSSLGPWSDRLGSLAFALTPLSVMLSSRESILSLITGVPYQSFNFLHRWLGYIIFLQSALHTIGWSIIEGNFYQPQPTTGRDWIKQTYMIWGTIAMIFLTILVVLSTPWAIKRTGYEFFRKSHYIIAMLYIGACWGHWNKLECWMIASLIVWFIDRGVRLLRSALVHRWYYSGVFVGFTCSDAVVTVFPDSANGDLLRLDFDQQYCSWEIGQHFYLCFTESSVWQSHPFTPCSVPHKNATLTRHTYLIRAKSGETKRLADKLRAKVKSEKQDEFSTAVILSGPTGTSIVKDIRRDDNILCIAGGTGITFVLPVLLSLADSSRSEDRKVELVWAIRKHSDMEWIRPELEALRAADIEVRVFVTRYNDTPAVDNLASTADKETSISHDHLSVRDLSATTESSASARHPDLASTVVQFVDQTVRGRSLVYASGPGGMITDLRTVVAQCNSASKVWKGDDRFDVELVCDDRLEW